MQTFPQVITPAVKAHLDEQFSLFSDMSKNLFSTMQKVNELNMQVAQTVLEESISSAQQVLEAKDPIEAITIATSQAQTAAEKLRAYQQHLTSIAAGTQVDLAKTAESHVPQATRTAAAVVEEVTQRAAEETEKSRQRQRSAMEKLTNPINRPSDASMQGQGASTQGQGASTQGQGARKSA
jgi:phasin family protein